MTASQIFLIVVSGLGVLHGMFLAILLWTNTGGNKLPNRLLSVLLVILSFRVGKSVFLEFLDDLDAKFIFIGLGTMMLIGPVFYFYSKALTDKAFSVTNRKLLHFLPALAAILFGLWIENEHLETLPKSLFLFLFLSYYGHYLYYLIRTKRYFTKRHKTEKNDRSYKLLNLIFYGLLVIWVAYFLNLIEEIVPYVVGPMLYSLAAYSISIIVISKGYLKETNKEKYKTTHVSEDQTKYLFEKVKDAIVEKEQYTNPDLTLKSLSASLNVSTQVLSMIINQKSGKNFNAFVNHYRIEEAMKMLADTEFENFTISAIAFKVGFNSLSSFNSAFKKQTNLTPKTYRQQLAK
ncbi:MAG: helix-turn-helix transcriptional regulator [Ekhidna sp.]|nr:helix-turn-helix transcriptional regulator [Ekhidna sp.]